jgi:D-glycero-alpha-D-manno-heptose-7-phosphate kinase
MVDVLNISRTPYRISLGGGGTDLQFYSRLKGGSLISAAINQYLTVSVAIRPLDSKILVQTTDVQFADSLDEIKNKIIKGTLEYFNINKSIQVSTFTTIPTGIGLGTSSTLIVGLVKILSKMKNIELSPMELGKISHYIERTILGFEGGIQDQYIASLGGIQILNVDEDDNVTSSPLFVENISRKELEKHLILVFTKLERSSTQVIKSQKKDISKTIEIYDRIKEIGSQSIPLIQRADIEGLGILMNQHWELKKSLSNKISNHHIDDMYKKLMNFGSPGGKIIGAGGGGFFLMAVPDKVDNYCKLIKESGYNYLEWEFDFGGSHIIN